MGRILGNVQSGLAYAMPVSIAIASFSVWTMYLLITLYLERRAILVLPLFGGPTPQQILLRLFVVLYLLSLSLGV